jgi:hypothetical protein
MSVMVEVGSESLEESERMGRERHVRLRLGEQSVTMAPTLAHEVADAIHAQAKLIEDDFPFRIVFK